MEKKELFCADCWVNHGVREPAVALVAQDFNEREPNSQTYNFVPVCEDHLSTWNDYTDDEYYPAYAIECLDGYEIEPSRTTIQSRNSDPTVSLDFKTSDIFKALAEEF